MTTETKPTFTKRHADDDYIDEVRIVVRERYKTSGMSGDEWRFHRVVQCFRKGHLLCERAFNGSITNVLGYAPLAVVEMMENAEFKRPDDEHLCFQPGCREVAVGEYELKEEFGPQGQKLDKDEAMTARWSVRRRFCRKHLRRGDCDREDCDDNYRVVSGIGPDGADMRNANVTESAQVAVRVDRIDDVGDAVAAAVRARNAPLQ